MKFKDELFAKYEIRKSKNEKTNFIEWVKELASKNKWEVNIERCSFGLRNIVIGNLNEAEVIFTAHYDTCAGLPFPNFITPKNFFIYLVYQLLLCFVLFIPMILFSVIFNTIFPSHSETIVIIGYVWLIGVCWWLMFGPANKHTANDNTSGVATILACLDKFNCDDKVAFVLFDGEEIGLLGSSSFASSHRDIVANTLLVNFDCVSDGDTMLFVLNNNSKDLLETFKESYNNPIVLETEVTYKGVFYPSDQIHFKKSVGVCAMKKNKFFRSGYIDRIHTKNDIIFRDENIEYLVQGSYKLYKNITK